MAQELYAFDLGVEEGDGKGIKKDGNSPSSYVSGSRLPIVGSFRVRIKGLLGDM